MIAFDTNVLVRFVVADDPDQASRARALVEKALAERTAIVITPVALVEAVWVWRRVMKQDKARVIAVIEAILASDPFLVLDADAVREALDSWRAGRGDLAEHLIAAQARRAGASATATFDEDVQTDAPFFAP